MFKASDVMLSDDSPLGFNGDVKMTFAVSIDGKEVADGADTEYFIPKATLTGKANASVKGNLELPLLKGRRRFDVETTSNLEVYIFRGW